MTTHARVRELISTGMTNKQIARLCGVSVATVKHHCSRIYAEVGAVNRVQAALALARQR